jgi:hypothetical protein
MSGRLTPRTLLFVPGDRLDKAAAAGADGAIIDLEDIGACSTHGTGPRRHRRVAGASLGLGSGEPVRN